MAQTIKLKRSGTSGAIPTTSQLELGEVAINTYDGKMYIKKNVGGTETIVEIGSGATSADAIFEEYIYTATSGQTSFSGSDDNSLTLSYTSGAVQVFLNGVLLDPDTDYTATNGTTVVLASGATTSDLLQIFAFKKKIGDGQTTVDTFTGNNSTTAFTLSLDPGDENNTRVYIDGVYQSKSNYSVSGTTLTFSTAPPTGTAIEVEIGNRVVTLDTLSDLDLPDNVKLRIGTSQDLEIFHNGTDSVVNQTGTGDLLIQKDETTVAEFDVDGLTVTGDVEADEFIGDIRGAVLFKAQAGETLAKGDVVYISGISGTTTVVSKADADDANKMPAFGIAAAAASANNPVDIYTNGILSGIDTSSYSEGDELFVSTTAGALTSTPPAGASTALQKIGKVTRSHASAGSIFVIGAGRSNAVPNLNDGDIFIGNGSNQATTASLNTKIESYLDGGTSTPQFSTVNSGNITTTGEIRGPATFVIDPAAVGDNTGTVQIKGNLQVDGTQTTINSTTLTVDDLNITLASGAANATAANGAGITIDGASATLTYDSSNDTWDFNKRIEVTGAFNATTAGSKPSITGAGIYGGGIGFIDTNVSGIYTDTSGANLKFFTNQSSSDTAASKVAMTINGSGQVGIGTASINSDSILHLKSTQPNIYFEDTDDSKSWRLEAGAVFKLQNITTSSEVFRIDQSDHLLINNTAYSALGTVVVQQTADSKGIAIIDSGAQNTFFFENEGDECKIRNNSGNPITFSQNPGERMRIDSSGNVIVNDTAASAPGLSVATGKNISFSETSTSLSYANMFRQSSSAALVLANGYLYTGTANKMASSISTAWAKSAIAVGSGFIGFYTDPISTVTKNTDITPTEAMRIDSSGNVGIGENTPLGKLHVKEGDSGATSVSSNFDQLVLEDDLHSGITILSGTSSDGAIYFGDSGGNAQGQIKYKHGSDSLNFIVNDGTEALIIDSSNNLLVGTSTTTAGNEGLVYFNGNSLRVTRDSNEPLNLDRLTTDGDIIEFRKNGSTVGRIGVASGPVSYIVLNDTTSDNVAALKGTSGAILPSTNAGADKSGTMSLGSSSARFNDLFLSGDINTTGSSITVDPSSGDAVLSLQGAAGAQTLRLDQNSIRTTTNTPITLMTNFSTVAQRILANGRIKTGIGVGDTDRNRHFTVEGSGDLMALYSTNDGAGGAQLDLIQDSSSAADDDAVGIINFSTDDRQYASIRGIAHNHSAGYGHLSFGVRTNTSTYNHNAMRIDENGNVGIGEISPTSMVHTNSSNSAHLKMQRNSNVVGFELSSTASGGYGLYDYTGTQYDAWFKNGKVTIGGSTDALQGLTVKGTIGSYAGETDLATHTLNNHASVSNSGTIEFVLGYQGTLASGRVFTFTYEATTWKSWMFEIEVASTHGFTTIKSGGYNNNSSGKNIYEVGDSQGGGTLTHTNSGQHNVFQFTLNAQMIHPGFKIKYTQTGGDGPPRMDRMKVVLT